MNLFEESLKPVALIDVNKLYRNLDAITARLDGAKAFAVVKSDAYGHGIALAEKMRDKVYGFAVAGVDEGVALRFMGIDNPVLALLPLAPSELRTAADYGISVVCADEQSAEAILKSKLPELSVHLKVDTGMNRLGFCDFKSFTRSLKMLARAENVSLDGIFSHFKNAACRSDCEMQFEAFAPYANAFRDYSSGLRHIAASGGLLQGGFNLDAVRVGILAYGYKPFNAQIDVQPIMKIVAPEISRRRFSDGDRCLYNAAVEAGEFSLVEYGYADGLPRRYAPTRCMNLSYEPTRGGVAVIMDDAEKTAERYGTICYEVLVSAARNLKKVYIGDA